MSFDPTLIVFIGLAAFLTYRLISVLGTRGGHEPDESERIHPMPTSERPSPVADEAPTPAHPEPSKPVPAWVSTVRSHYPSFNDLEFVKGAKSAYEMIVEAYAKGNLAPVRDYIDPAVEKTFQIAIDGRDHAGQKMEVTFVGIEKADVLSAAEKGKHVEVTIAFQSDQIRLVRDANGDVIDGDPNRIDLVRDIWTFSRPIDSRDPNWTLTATDGSAPTAA